MAPLKIEEEMKQKLEERRIEPSADSWQRLSSRLDNKDKSKPRSGFWWIGLAAACIAILLILKIRPESNENNTVPVIVDTVKEAEEPVQTVENDTQSTSVRDEEEIIPKEISEEQLVESTANTHEKDTAEEEKSKSPLVRVALADESIPDDTDKTSGEQAKILMEEKASLESKLAENTAEVPVSTEVSNAELDELLEKARKRLNSEATQKKKAVSVQAQALLDEVEDDLDRSFRERVFRTLVSGYESVKTAVAERNN